MQPSRTTFLDELENSNKMQNNLNNNNNNISSSNREKHIKNILIGDKYKQNIPMNKNKAEEYNSYGREKYKVPLLDQHGYVNTTRTSSQLSHSPSVPSPLITNNLITNTPNVGNLFRYILYIYIYIGSNSWKRGELNEDITEADILRTQGNTCITKIVDIKQELNKRRNNQKLAEEWNKQIARKENKKKEEASRRMEEEIEHENRLRDQRLEIHDQYLAETDAGMFHSYIYIYIYI